MNYGNFSKDGKEYLIHNQRTPSPWINYLYNGRYFTTISNNGGGISYYKSPLHGRITRYRINDVPPDRPGKYIYVKDNETGETWSLTWQPMGKHLEAYRVAHGFGYTRAEASVNGIDSSVLFFVPREDDQEIWKATLVNSSAKSRKLSVYGYAELALGHALVDLINQCDDQHFNRAYFDKELNTLFSTKTYWVTETKGTQQQENQEWDQWTFFSVNKPVSGFETLRERFMGSYRNETNPESIENENLSCLETDFGNVVSALKVDIELLPGESTDVVFSLGVIEKIRFEELKEVRVHKYQSVKEVGSAFDAVLGYWNDYFSYTKAETPDHNFNTFLNYWMPYQAKVAFDVGRVVSFYYWGIGRGFGFRDTSQDTIAITISDPEKAKERIRLLSRQMQKNGKVFHHFYGDGKGEFTRHCDDPLWFILAVVEYLKETRDFNILDEPQSFIDGGSGTIQEHLLSVANFARDNLGQHGIPIFGRGDWNDTLDYIGGDEGGESVWGGMFYVAMLNLLIELLENRNLLDSHRWIADLRDKLIHAIETHCWDGEWYLRAIGEKGKKIGSKENKYGKIFLNTQVWPVIAGFPNPARLTMAMNSVKKYLDSPEGPKKCTPAWKEIDKNIGLVTRCVWGKKENGAVFCHPASWVIQAETILGRGQQAFDYLKKMLPDRIDSDTYVAEPYVFSQYITSNEHSLPGRASHSWQTGSAAWMFRVSYDHILGIRPTYRGLIIDPVIPASWEEFSIERVFRGTRYYIHVSNPYKAEKGIASLVVDGIRVPGNIIVPSEKPVCMVEVLMGKPNKDAMDI
ncbi:MAG: glycosyl transferase family 36 [Bacteroidetes bacterium]|nr:glycosyl transferase family 36 [Bacteroidota bacterium]